MGNVSSKPDDGSTLFLRDQNRRMLLLFPSRHRDATLLTLSLRSEYLVPRHYQSPEAHVRDRGPQFIPSQQVIRVQGFGRKQPLGICSGELRCAALRCRVRL